MSRYGSRQWAKWKKAGALSGALVYVETTIANIAEIKGRGFLADVEASPPLKVGDVVCQDFKAWKVVGVERHPFHACLLKREADPSSRPVAGACEIVRMS